MSSDNTPFEWADWGSLRPLERELLVNVIQGNEVRGKTEFLSKTHHAPDVDGADYHTISAELLSRLIIDEKARRFIHPYGIRIVGAYIVGKLNLDTASIPFPLVLQDCYIPETINLRDANTRLLSFTGSHTGRIRASRIVVESSLVLNDGFWAKGEVRLHGARITGQFDCRHGRFYNPIKNDCASYEEKEYALMADDMRVDCDMYLTGVRATGTISLGAAQIYDDLKCEGAHFINPNGKALVADRIHVGGHVFFTFFEGDKKHKPRYFKAFGQVSLIQAKIKGSFFFRSAVLCDKGQVAVEAREANMAGSAWFSAIKTNGLIRLTGSVIKGCLYFIDAKFIGERKTGLMGKALNVKGTFSWISIKKMPTTQLDLRYATVGQLQDEVDSWPDAGNLMLEGLVYDSLVTKLSTEERKNWLELQLTERFTRDDIVRFEDLAKMIIHSDDLVCLRLRSRLLKEDIETINRNLRKINTPLSTIDEKVILLGLNDLLQDEDLYKEFQTMGRSLSSKGQKFKEKLLEQKKKNGKEFVRQTLAHLNCEILKTVYEKLIEQKIKNEGEFERQTLAHLNCEILKTVYPQIKSAAKPHRRYFREQPYEQLASFLLALGMDTEAKEILIAKNDAKRKYGTLPWIAWLLMGRYQCMTEYGYKPLKAATKSIYFILFGWLAFMAGYEDGLMVPSKEYVYMNKPYRTEKGGDVRGELPSTYPEFDPFIYSLETFVPFLDLHQKAYWLPLSKGDTDQDAESRKSALMQRSRNSVPWYVDRIWLPLVKPIFNTIAETWKPVILHLWMWFEICVGWILSTFFLAGVLGLMHEFHPHKKKE